MSISNDMWWKDTIQIQPKRVKGDEQTKDPQPQRWSPLEITQSNDDLSSLFQFKADGGMIGPLSAPGIYAYQQCSLDLKQNLLKEISKEWSELTDVFIRAKWPGGSDIFYILHDQTDGSLIGCVAVDRSNFYPYISNLYVTPTKRRQGHAKTLINHGIAFTKSMGFQEARLWCKEHLLKWYQSMGFKQDGTQGQVYLMVKN